MLGFYYLEQAEEGQPSQGEVYVQEALQLGFPNAKELLIRFYRKTKTGHGFRFAVRHQVVEILALYREAQQPTYTPDLMPDLLWARRGQLAEPLETIKADYLRQIRDILLSPHTYSQKYLVKDMINQVMAYLDLV